MNLKLDQISKSFNGKTVLKNLTLSVQEGDRLVIYGPSGSGKSTLLKIIAGFIQPDAGKIEMNGVVAARDGKCLLEPEKRGIGMVFQDLALWPHMTVYENIAFGLRAKRLSSEEIQNQTKSMIKKVRLTKHQDSLPSQISGGEQQRVALARALAPRPRILLMDEPLSHLDEELAKALAEEILKLHKEFHPILIYTTHNRQEGSFLASRIVTMDEGVLTDEAKN
ncbi:MAG: ABC transporter ATP-binding protein [Chlamydiae bacterium]|nr:ABC transporter ATP-binding protein [Chlamydiota bacterium]